MMWCRAAAVDRFPGVSPHGVDQARGRQRLQGAIDGGKTDGRTAVAQFVVQFLRGTEAVERIEERDDGPTLPGGADAGADGPPANLGGRVVTPRAHRAAIGNHFHYCLTVACAMTPVKARLAGRLG